MKEENRPNRLETRCHSMNSFDLLRFERMKLLTYVSRESRSFVLFSFEFRLKFVLVMNYLWDFFTGILTSLGLHKKSGKLVFLGLDNAGKVREKEKENEIEMFYGHSSLDDAFTHVKRRSFGSTCSNASSE